MNPSIQYNLILNSINRRQKIFQEIKTNPIYKELLTIINSDSCLNKEYIILFRYYMIKYLPEKKPKKILLEHTLLDNNNSTLFNFLHKGTGHDFKEGGLIQICMSLDLSYAEAFDLFISCGCDLTADTPIQTLCNDVLRIYCKKDFANCLTKIIDIDEYCTKRGFPYFICKKGKKI